ncbi:hypothetical protein [Clostridium tertium]|uniref:hypothetical protein n=1 Tax=Clostridium tertium TaxID=1559 RepID=UPI001AE3599F|nr:hypothetical protein [Clostridium tertium]MBP1869039.1 hypothetical protein [Clostridium tertium]
MKLKSFEELGFNIENNEDCKKYIMEYEQFVYEWKVYVDDIEGWQDCKLIDIQNRKLGITRATVICQSGTQLNRRVKFVTEEYEMKPDGCIYFI